MEHPPSNTSPKSTCGCREFQSLAPTRRSILGSIGAAGVAATLPAWIPRVSYAASDSGRDIVISIFLRGGADGLTMVAPYLEPNLGSLRPTLAVRPPDASSRAALDLDGQFGFAPALAPLLDAFNAGDLAVVHATGSKHGTRSHFDAMHFMEVGRPDPTLLSGWLARHLQATPPLVSDPTLRALGIGYGLQKTLLRAPLALPVPDIAEFGYQGNPETEAAREQVLRHFYEEARRPLATNAQNTFRTVSLLQQIDVDGYRGDPARAYPEGEFGHALRSAAALIRAEVGVEAIAVDYGSWDTHDEQAPFDGEMNTLMQTLAEGLAALHADLYSQPRCRVTVVVMSEFGRNAFENASGGTDHGHGNVLFVLSPGARGGMVHTDWPGLEREQLWEGQDLDVTWDYRDVLYEILTKRLENPDATGVFGDPDYAPVDRGILFG